jgi:hypothetical protein
MQDDYLIHLNFLPVKGFLPTCELHRRRCASANEQRPFAAAAAYSLPVDAGDTEAWEKFWVVLEAGESFERFEFNPSWNLGLTRRVLFASLIKSVETVLRKEQYRLPTNEFIEEVSLIMETHPEGDELLVIQPYSLRALRRIGFLVDFRFHLREGVVFNRRVQQLSLSLTKNFRRNADHHVDRSSKINHFLETRWELFSRLKFPGSSELIAIDRDFAALPAERLRPKMYVFSGDRESRSQFAGLRDFGPLQQLPAATKLLFVFRERDRQAARRLAVSLRGLKQQGQFSFPGFKRLFKTDIEIDPQPVVLPDLSEQTMAAVLDRAKSELESATQLVPIIVLPEGEDNGYYELKALFSNSSLPTQVCTLKILEDEELLKWSIANLALQIFCKAGGLPWKVRPTAERSLIIGISQSHKTRLVGNLRRIEKYFAFSVLTDSSGLFQRIRVLGQGTDDSEYVSELQINLKTMLEENAGLFKRVVIHTSFKLKRSEMDAIQRTTQEVAKTTARSGCKFAVIKVNHRNRFFGVNRSVNSLVPFEGTKIRLGRNEYLVWFEGLSPELGSVTRAFQGPTHLQFLRISDEGTGMAAERELLQDIVNLSGANWRGFNAKSAPVSIFYCHLVADLVQDFHDRGLPLPAVEDIRPWFL